MKLSSAYAQALVMAYCFRYPKEPADFQPLIEARVEMLRPHLNEFTFGKLGNIGLHGEMCHEQSSLYQLNPTIFADMHSVSTINLDHQGIYGYHNDMSRMDIGSNGVMKIWGFSRNNFWLQGEIHFTKAPDIIGWKASYKAEIFLKEIALEKLIPTFAQHIWFALGETIKELHEKQAKRFAITLEMSEAVELDEILFQLGK
jgi:hypothetical protein